MCFLFGSRDKKNLIHFLKNLIDVTLILNLHESSKISIPFLDLKVSLSNGNLSTDLHIKYTDRH